MLTVIPVLDDLSEKRAQAHVERIIPTLSPALLEGRRLYERHNCEICHGPDGSGRPSGPSLFDLTDRRSAKYIREHVRDPRTHNPRSDMPKTALSEKELDLLVDYLLTMKRD